MKEKIKSVFLGILLILIGAGYVGNALDIWEFSIFFKGWWTLFIIVPALLSILSAGLLFSNLLVLAVGTYFLLEQRNIIPNQLFNRLFFPVLVVFLGVLLIVKSLKSKSSSLKAEFCFAKDECDSASRKSVVSAEHDETTGCDDDRCIAFFNTRRIDFSNRKFKKSDCVAFFGRIKLDLRNADIEDLCKIDVMNFFGSTEIILPEDIAVNATTIPVFGSTVNCYESSHSSKCVKIESVCIFGETKIKG